MKIVLIEDSNDLRMAWKYLFLAQGLNLEMFSSAEEALDNFSCLEESDLIITDYNLKTINGLELIRFVKKTCPDKVIFFFTGINDEKIIEQIKAVAHCYHFNKPVMMDCIKTKISELFKK